MNRNESIAIRARTLAACRAVGYRALCLTAVCAAVLSAGVVCAQGVTRVTNPTAQQAAGAPAAPMQPGQLAPQIPPLDQAPGTGQATAAPPLTAAQGARPAPSNAAMPTPYLSTSASVLDRIAPLQPKDMLTLRQKIKERSEAATEPLSDAPSVRPTSTQTTIDLSPGATPPLIRIAPHQGAAIMFVDAAGRPWPVESADNFNGQAVSVSQSSDHTFSVGMQKAQIGNIAFKLKDIARPIVVTVKPAQEATDYNVDLVVPKFFGGSPPTALGSAAPSPSYMADELMEFLYRTPPRTARRLTTSGSSTGELMAWQTSATTMVVRTSAQVLSPAWKRRQGSSDGVFVYEIPLTPVVSISEGGEMRQVGFGNINVEPMGNATSVAGAILQGANK